MIRTLLIILSLACLLSCSDFGRESIPFIDQVDPVSGTEGDTVIVSGEQFGAGPESRLLFGNAAGEIVSWADDRIASIVPNVRGKTVQVIRGDRESNAVPFASLGTQPHIVRVEPDTAEAGDTIQVNGFGFQAEETGPVVSLNDIDMGNIFAFNDTTVQLVVGENAQSGQLRINRDGLESNSVSFVLFEAPPAPTIIALVPDSAFAGDTIQVIGNAFGGSPDSGSVFLAGLTGTPVEWSDTVLSVIMPEDAETGEVIVIVGMRESNALSLRLLIPPAPIPAVWEMLPSRTFARDTLFFLGPDFGDAPYDRRILFSSGTGERAEAEILRWRADSVVVLIPENVSTGGVVIAGKLGETGSNFFEVTTRIVSWEGDVQPLIREFGCTNSTCHNPIDRTSNYSLETWEDARGPGSRFPPVRPRRGPTSLLISLLRGPWLGAPQMPIQLQTMNESDILVIEDWINQGAHYN